ncbi:MAG TPA: hypothetical protein VN207_05345, partial [Ktedonobacteraceae bacterium]|nr:hypothetical protein [Ktedonobacteraceae bacterium]
LLLALTRCLAVVLLSGELVGIFFGMIVAPSLYFQEYNPFLLTTSGEFVVKNLVLITAALVIHREHHLSIISATNDVIDIASALPSNAEISSSVLQNN